MKKIRISAVLWAMIASIAMILVGLVGIVPQAQATMPANTATASGAASTTNRNVTIIAFQQNWKSIAKECTETYGPEGVGYVEVSPPSESIKGSQWWTSYQPVSYKLDSKEGTEADFKQMIATCKAAGVGIIADAVINHTTGADHPANVGVDGSKFDAQGNFPAIGYTKDDFHDCARNIGNYNDANEVWNCRLTGLQDLNTSKAQVQDKIADYMKHLLDDGVAGFRVDAVKHMDPQDVSAIKAKLAQKSGMAEDKIYWNQETLGNANEDPRIQPSNYVSTGEVHEMNFPYRLKTAFNGGDGNVSGLKDLSSKLLPSQEASVFVSNWDTERNASTLNYKDGSRYLLANAFMLAYGYGTPYINSGYKFEDSAAGHDAGAPGATDTSVPDTVCSTDSGWLCTQRWTAIRGMIGFHNAVSGEVTNWWSNGSTAIAFGRGTSGYLAINNSDQDISQTFATGMPAGEYCDVYGAGDCSTTVKVGADGRLQATVPAHSALAIHARSLKSVYQPGAKSNPLDPAKDEPRQGPVDSDRTVNVYYKTSWKTPYLHYQKESGWTDLPGVAMAKACDGYYMASMPLISILDANHKQEFLFTDGGGNWDHPNGQSSGNYSISEKADLLVADGKLSEVTAANNPCAVAYKPTTRLTVHYRPAAGDSAADKRGVYVWGTREDGSVLDGKNYQFNQSKDAFGKVFTMDFDGSFDKLGVIVTTTDWNKDGQSDRMVDVSGGSGEIWVKGGDETTYTTPPDEAGQTIKKLDVTVHYRRADNNYTGWDIWQWADGVADNIPAKFTDHDSFGETARYSQSSGSGVKGSTFIIRYSDGTNDWASREAGKDNAEGHRVIPQSAITMTGRDTAKAEVWIVSGDTTVYTNPANIDTSDKIVSSEISQMNQVTIKLNHAVNHSDLEGKLSLKGADLQSFEVKDGTTVVITTKEAIPANAAVTVDAGSFGKATAVAGSVVRTDAFDKAYAYEGKDLGASYTAASTTFKIWAPTASSVKLNSYKSTAADAALAKSYPMTAGAKGVWTVTLPGDCKDLAYDFSLAFPDGKVNEAADPYGTASTVNGGRSVVLTPQEMKPAVWGKRMSAFTKPADAVITEMSVRDFSKSSTSGISAKNQGKYLGVVEEGSKNSKGESTGIDYLKKSGTTHVQIMPMYDFNNVNGEIGNNVAYNWGYDPMNYNVPEGSYSSDPANPATRVVEAKKMLQGLHKAGIRVIMDVVYNHVYDANKHVFNQVVPGYYFRYDAKGNLVSNSGCGNDTASERAMMRKYIVDSVTYWAKNYNLDGFRFDLMGLIDKETMKEVRSALDQIDPSILVLGEGWDMNTTMEKSRMSIQPNGYELATDKSSVAFFNDSYRDAIKGSVFDKTGKGFVQGQFGQESLLANNFMGCQNQKGFAACTNGNANVHYASANQLVQYVEVHDNLTLYDKLVASMPGVKQDELVKRDQLATAMVLLAQGVPEMQLGQTFLRTKGGDDNSYNKPDSENAVDWDRLDQFKTSDDYARGLIALRKALPAFRLGSYDQINSHVTVIAQKDGLLAFKLADASGTYLVAFNGNGKAMNLTGLKKGTYTVVSSDGAVDSAAVKEIAAAVKNGSPNVRKAGSPKFQEVQVTDGTYSVPATSALVLKEGELLAQPAISQVEDPDTIQIKSQGHLTLPQTVKATWTDGRTTMEKVTWPALTAEQKGIIASADGGEFSLNGTVAGYGKPVTVVVKVAAASKPSEPSKPSDPSHPGKGKIVITLSLVRVRAGWKVRVMVKGLAPHTAYVLWLHSSPVKLVAVTSNASGEVDRVVTIPVTTAPGKHQVLVTAASVSADKVLASAPLTVLASSQSGTAQPSQPAKPAPSSQAAKPSQAGRETRADRNWEKDLATTGVAVTSILLAMFGFAGLGLALTALRGKSDKSGKRTGSKS